MTQRMGPRVSLPEFKCRHLHVLICKMGLLMLPGSWGCLRMDQYRACSVRAQRVFRGAVYSPGCTVRADHLLLLPPVLQMFNERLLHARHSCRPWGFISKQEQ